MTDPVKVLDDLVKGLVLVAYDFVRLTLFGLFLPVFRYVRKWRSLTRKLPFLTLSTTKRLSALTYLVIWILLVIAYASGRFANFAANVIGIPNKADVQSGLSVPELLAAALFVTVFVDVSLRLTLSGIQNRVRRDLYGVMARIAVANIFCGAFIILTIEGYRIRNTFALFGSIPALFWPAELFKHWIMPANPLLSLFALALVIVCCAKAERSRFYCNRSSFFRYPLSRPAGGKGRRANQGRWKSQRRPTAAYSVAIQTPARDRTRHARSGNYETNGSSADV